MEKNNTNLLTVENNSTTVHTFRHVALSFLFMKYSLGIHNIKYEEFSEQGAGIGWLTVSSDGMLIFKAMVNRDWTNLQTLFLVQFFDGKEYKIQSPKTLTQLKRMFINNLKQIPA
jgi:hypothetical protein